MNSSFWRRAAYWKHAIDTLYDAYGGVCAYAAVRIEKVAGSPTVEHFRPKSLYPRQAYDWTNLRLVCGRMNGRKQNHEDVLDPFTLRGPVFDLNLVSGEIAIHRQCPQRQIRRANSTLNRLKLNDPLCRQMRIEHVDKIVKGDWSEAESAKQSPFVFECLRAQGLI